MSTRQVIELLVAAALIVAGVLQYRKRSHDGGRRGSQGAVILFIVGAIVAIHGLGLMQYRPSAAELRQ